MTSEYKEAIDELRRSRQVMRRGRLLDIATDSGFSIRTTGKHIRLTHRDKPKVALGISSDTNDARSRLLLADALERVAKLKDADAKLKDADTEENTGSSPDETAAYDFNESAKLSLNLPDDIELRIGRKQPGYYIRLRSYPQIATQIALEENAESLEPKIENLRKRGKKLEELLARVNEYDFERKNYGSGMIVLTHKTYPDIQLELRPFTPRLQNFTCHSRIEEAFMETEIRDAEIKEELEALKQAGDITPKGRQKDEQTGDITHFYEHICPFTTRKTPFEITTTPHNRVSQERFIELADMITDLRFKTLKQDLKKHYGLNFRPNRDGTFTLSHAAYEDMNVTVPDIFSFPSLAERVETLSTEEDYKKVTDAIIEASEQRQIVINNCIEMASSAIDRQICDSEKIRKILAECDRKKIGRRAAKNITHGEPLAVTFDPPGKSDRRILLVRTTNPVTGDERDFIRASELKKLEKFVASVPEPDVSTKTGQAIAPFAQRTPFYPLPGMK